jgi:nitrogen fixation protein FixH
MTELAVSRYSRFIPWLFVAGMLVVVAVNGALIYFATSTWSGIAVSRSYERGLSYNHALSAAARQETLGWSVNASVDTPRTLQIRIFDRAGTGIGGLQVEAALERPVGAADKQLVRLQPAVDGIYSSPLPPLRPGQWDAQITASRGSDSVYVTQRLFVP